GPENFSVMIKRKSTIADSTNVSCKRERAMKSQYLLWVLWVTMPFLAAAQDSSKVIAMENAWNQAEVTKDAVAVHLLLADDFIMTTADGTLYNKPQLVASVRDQSYHPEALQSSDMVVHTHGTTAIVTGAYYEKGIDKGKRW